MHDFSIMSLLVCGLGAWGIALLLTRQRPSPRRMGTAVSAIVLAVILSRYPFSGKPLLAGWPSFWAASAFVLPAGFGLAAAITALCGRGHRGGLAWFVAIAAANSALLFSADAVIAGVTNLIVNVGCLGPLLLLSSRSNSPEHSPSAEPVSEFNWLVCAIGGLFLAGLMAALPVVSGAIGEPATGPTATVSPFGWRDLGWTLLFEHGVSLTAVGLLLLIAVVTVSRLTTHEAADTATEMSGGPAT